MRERREEGRRKEGRKGGKVKKRKGKENERKMLYSVEIGICKGDNDSIL